MAPGSGGYSYPWRMWIFELIAAPAHLWLVLAAWLVGGKFVFVTTTVPGNDEE